MDQSEATAKKAKEAAQEYQRDALLKLQEYEESKNFWHSAKAGLSERGNLVGGLQYSLNTSSQPSVSYMATQVGNR